MAVVDYQKPLQLMDLPDPVRKPGHVMLKILTCGVCFSDYKTSKGLMHYSDTLPLPHVPGHEICGEVIESEAGSPWQPGDMVIAYHYWSCGTCVYCQRGLENLCINLESWTGFTHHGGFEEFLSVPEDRLLRVPAGLSPAQASTATCASGTAFRATVTRGQVAPGDTVVIIGTGGVGLMATQFATLSGGAVIGLDIDQRKLDIIKGFGVAGTARSEAEARALVDELTRGIGADVIINTISNPAGFKTAANLVRRGGRIVGVGYYAGKNAEFETANMVLNEYEVLGSRYALRYEMQRVLDLFAAGKVQAMVDSILPLEDANEAFRRLAEGEVVGRTVLRVAND